MGKLHEAAAPILLACLAAAPAHAGLLGQSVTVNYNYGTDTYTDIVTATATPAITCPGAYNVCTVLNSPTQTIRFGNGAIAYAYKGPGTQFTAITPNGFDFKNLNLGKPIKNVVLTTNIAGLTAANVTFTATSVQINMSGLAVQSPRAYFRVTLKTR